MSESKDYQTLRKNMCEPLDRIDRVENIVVAGMPDVNFCGRGTECWIELKSPKEPKKPSTPLFGSNHRLSQDQKNWFLKQQNSNGKAYILIATDKRWLLIDGKYADDVNNLTITELIQKSTWWRMRHVEKEQWKALRTILVKR